VNTDRITILFVCFGKLRSRLFGMLVCLALSVSWAYDFAVFERQILARFGPARVAVLREWQSSISEAKKSVNWKSSAK
jgi:hypothetical protein